MINLVEELIGMKLPAIKILIKSGSLYQKVLQDKKPQLVNDSKIIKGLLTEFTENKILKKLIPKIYQTLDIRSVIDVPLLSKGKVMGLLEVSRKDPFTESDLKRFKTISEQLISIIEHKQSEQALKESEKKYRTVFKNTGTTTVTLGEDETISLENSGFEKLSGYPKSKI